jgi:hypothetical protein
MRRRHHARAYFFFQEEFELKAPVRERKSSTCHT